MSTEYGNFASYETFRIIPAGEDYQTPTQRSDAQKVLDTVLSSVEADAEEIHARAAAALEMLSVVDREGAAKFGGLPNQARKLVEYVAELRRLRG